MTKEKISEYDPSADGNTDVNGVNIAEGCAPSGINNAIREVMAALKRFETGSDGDSITVGGNLVVSGTANVSGASTFSGATTFSSSVVISGATTATTVSATVIQSDTINEKTSAAGVTIDGVLLKDTTVTANTVKASGTSSSQGEVQFFEDTDNGTNYVALKAPASVASDVTWTLPNADGTADQVLKTDGSGNLGWAASGGSAEIGTLQQFYKSDFITPDATFPDSTWLKADGSVVSQATYTDLFDRVGLQPDGLNNFEHRSTVSGYIYGFVYGDNLWVAAGNGGALYTSTDAITWTSRTSGITAFIYALTYGNSLYVYGAGGGVIRTSTNGITWTARTSGSATTTYISSLTFGDNLYVYGNNIGAIRSSTNGITWTARTSGSSTIISGLAYGNGVFVYGDYSGQIRTSTDAITWTARTSGLATSEPIYSLTYGDGIFVAGAGQTSRVLTSTDGVTWTKTAEGFPGVIYKIAYDDGIYLLQASNIFGLYSSTDAVNWTLISQLESGAGNASFSCGAGGGMYVHGAFTSIFSAPKYTYNTATEFALPKALGRAEDEQLAVYIKATT